MLQYKKRVKNSYSNKSIILYGAGELSKLASEFFNFYGIKYIVCVDDVTKDKIDLSFDIDSIVNIKDVSTSDNPLVLICISTVSFNKIKNKLNDLGFVNVKSFFEVAEKIQKANGYKHPLTNGWTHNLEKKDKKIKRIFNIFVLHTQSYFEYYSFFEWHKNYEEWCAYCTNCNNRYFIPEIIEILHDHETFIDVGAYDGRVSRKFSDIVKNKYKEIHMFEPQLSCCVPLGEKIEDEKNINLYHTCLGNKNGWIYFNDNHNYLCKPDRKSKKTSAIRKLDTLMKLKNIEPNLIKIHVEGYELNVLKGAVKTIKKYRPILMVTTYHTEDGLYKIPLWLIKHCKNYKFHWRNHNYMGQGAVMYAIPKERYK